MGKWLWACQALWVVFHCDVLLKLRSNNVTKYLHSMDLECESESNYTNWGTRTKTNGRLHGCLTSQPISWAVEGLEAIQLQRNYSCNIWDSPWKLYGRIRHCLWWNIENLLIRMTARHMNILLKKFEGEGKLSLYWNWNWIKSIIDYTIQ
jgi:hypothetical protein